MYVCAGRRLLLCEHYLREIGVLRTFSVLNVALQLRFVCVFGGKWIV